MQVKRPLTREEFQKMQQVFHSDGRRFLWKYGLSSLTKFQFHMIGRIDDTMQVLVENIQVHGFYPSEYIEDAYEMVQKRIRGKGCSVADYVGAMDMTYCVLTSLALWLELHARSNPNALLLLTTTDCEQCVY